MLSCSPLRALCSSLLFLYSLIGFIHFSAAQTSSGSPAQSFQTQAAGRRSSGTQSLGTQISGTVKDPSGAAIANASVVLKNASGTVVESGSTGPEGGFLFPGIANGQYLLSVESPGFKPFQQKVEISGRLLRPLALNLSIAALSADISVQAQSAEVSTEPAENHNTTELDPASLAGLPVLDQDYIAFLAQFLDPGSTATGGLSLVVNGVEANGPGVTQSAVQSVKINDNPYSTLFARPGRARLEITTKGGTPKLHGELNFSLRDSLFDAKPAYAPVKPNEQRRYFEGSLTGPLTSAKTTFLLSADYDSLNNEAVVNAVTPSGSVNENVATPMRHAFTSARVFHDYGEGNQFWIGYSYEQRSQHNQGVGGTVLPEAGYRSEFQEHEINIGQTNVISAKWLNQFRILFGHYNAPTISNLEAPNITVPGSFEGGGAQADGKRTEYHTDSNDTVTYSSGKHEVKFGYDLPDISRRGADDWTNQLGSYTFSSLAAYAAGKPQTLFLQRGQGHLTFLEANFALFAEDTYKVLPSLSVTYGARYYFQNFFHDDPNNIAPRLAFAWAPTHDRKTVVRGGAGIFYDRTGPGPIAQLLHFNGINLRRYVIDNPSYPFLPDTSSLPISTVSLAPNAQIPYIVQWGIGVEHQLTQKAVVTVNWEVADGIKRWRALDLNAPLAPDFTTRPDPARGQELFFNSDGRFVSRAFYVDFKGAITRWFTGQVQYRFQHAYSDTEGINYVPSNSYAPESDYSRASWDERNRFSLLGSFRLPEHFTAGAALTFHSGDPYTELTGFDNNGDGILNDRPAGVPRNSLTGPSYGDVDVRFARDFKFNVAGDATTLTTSLSAFNALNHKNDAGYVGFLTSPFFGRATSALPPRRLQLNLAFKF